MLPFLIFTNQSVNLFISEGGRLISELLEISDTLKLDGLLATIDSQMLFEYWSFFSNLQIIHF